MNFRPTLWKSIVSLIVLIAIDLIIARYFIMCISDFGPCDPWYSNTLEPLNIVISLIASIIIYIIWSLFQNKKR